MLLSNHPTRTGPCVSTKKIQPLRSAVHASTVQHHARRTSPIEPSPRLDAVVIGAGMAGLACAAGLSRRFSHVADARERKGVSQYQQPHFLLMKGLHSLESLFPGMQDKLLTAGARRVDVMRNFLWFDFGKEAPMSSPDTVVTLAASRHLYETTLRDQVMGISNINTRTAALASGLDYDKVSQQVKGVVLQSGETIHADLVVDASGKSSDIPTWLDQIGHPTVPTMSVDAGLRYASCVVELPADPDRTWDTAVCQDQPVNAKTGVLVGIEDNKWQVILTGYPGSYPPIDPKGFLEFARSLPSQTIYNALHNGKIVSKISRYAKTGNFRRRFDKVSPPQGLCVIGDAACYFNPVNGQGMTTGIAGAELLCNAIDARLDAAGNSQQEQRDAIQGLSAAFQAQLGSFLDFPWSMSSGIDASRSDAEVDMPAPENDVVAEWIGSYIKQVAIAQMDDPYVRLQAAKVFHMTEPPTRLFLPDVAVRVMAWWLGKRFVMLQNKYAGQDGILNS